MNNPLVLEWFPLWIAHILRGTCILVGPFCMILSIKLTLDSKLAQHRKLMYGGAFFLSASAIYTQVERWDQPATLRLFIVTPGILLLFAGLWTMRHYKSKEV